MKKFYLLISMFFIFGCMENNPKTPLNVNRVSYPVWIANPTMNGKYKFGAVGCAGRSYEGPSKQRKIAIERAIEELGSQMGTTVTNNTLSIETATSERSSYKSQSVSTYAITQNVSGRIMDVWEDHGNNKLYIWMVVDK